MREIKFRGKTRDTHEWVYGTPLTDIDGITSAMVVVSDERVSVIGVDPETVGQFTGLLDREGIRIYEHDIIDATIPEGITFRGVVKFKDGSFYVDAGTTLLFCWADYKVKYIGNIHENPEILEVLSR